jgi:hypothetical protein
MQCKPNKGYQLVYATSLQALQYMTGLRNQLASQTIMSKGASSLVVFGLWFCNMI